MEQYFRQRFQDEVNVLLSQRILAHAAALDYANFEDPEYQDLITKARHNPSDHGVYFLTLVLSIAMGVIQALSLTAVLIYIEPLILPLILAVSVPYFFFRTYFARRRTEEELARAQKRRWTGYYSGQLINPDQAAETRMFNLSSVFLQQYGAILEEFRTRNIRFYRLDLVGTSLFVLASLLVVYVAFSRATLSVVNRGLTIGDIAIFGAAATQLRSIIERTINLIGSMRQQLIFTGVMMEFLAIQPRQPAADRALPTAICGEVTVDDVTFTYPGAERPTLQHVTFHIRPGETIALVGRNGSGKTTLAKLIARLYDVDAGAICIDGVNVQCVDPDSLHRQIAYVAQNFSRYEATAFENIAYGDWERLQQEPDKVQAVARFTGVDEVIEAMPHGYQTKLGRLFGETTLSGGQWQRIAITRALARDTRIVILDEPTANLDMHAEYRLYQHFRQLAAGRTAILISHRFSTVRMADRVIVLDKGRIVEQGSHDELLRHDGHYAALFRLFEQQMLHGNGATAP